MPVPVYPRGCVVHTVWKQQGTVCYQCALHVHSQLAGLLVNHKHVMLEGRGSFIQRTTGLVFAGDQQLPGERGLCALPVRHRRSIQQCTACRRQAVLHPTDKHSSAADRTYCLSGEFFKAYLTESVGSLVTALQCNCTLNTRD